MLEDLKKKELPYWLEELVMKDRFSQKYFLFQEEDAYVICKNKEIKPEKEAI